MIKDLCTGYFGNNHRVAGNFTKWKIYYANYCQLPVENGETVFDDICTLQRKRIIGVGKYGVLLDIFAKIDESATRIIKEASDSIRQNNETERKDQREPKYGDTNPYTAKITVRTPDRSKEMHNDITEILNELVNHTESVFSKDGLDKNNGNPSSRKNVESLLERFVKKNNQSQEMSTCIWEESLGLFRAMKICHGVDSCHIYSEDGYVVISVEFGTKKDKKRVCNDDESKLKNKVKYTFKLFFTVASLKRPDINVRIIDS